MDFQEHNKCHKIFTRQTGQQETYDAHKYSRKPA